MKIYFRKLTAFFKQCSVLCILILGMVSPPLAVAGVKPPDSGLNEYYIFLIPKQKAYDQINSVIHAISDSVDDLDRAPVYVPHATLARIYSNDEKKLLEDFSELASQITPLKSTMGSIEVSDIPQRSLFLTLARNPALDAIIQNVRTTLVRHKVDKINQDDLHISLAYLFDFSVTQKTLMKNDFKFKKQALKDVFKKDEVVAFDKIALTRAYEKEFSAHSIMYGEPIIAQHKLNQIVDLTQPISENTPVYPGDPPFERNKVSDINEPSQFILHRISLSNHLGTHIDFPAHVILGGKDSNHYMMRDFISEVVIVETAGSLVKITDIPDMVEGKFVFFRTENKDGHLSTEAAEEIVSKGIKLVGIDSQSVDSIEQLDVHRTLLSNGVLIIENLRIPKMAEKLIKAKAHIAPIKIENMDGLPVRVFVDMPCR